ISTTAETRSAGPTSHAGSNRSRGAKMTRLNKRGHETSWPPNNETVEDVPSRPENRARHDITCRRLAGPRLRFRLRIGRYRAIIIYSLRKCRHGVRSMVQRVRRTGLAVFAILTIMGCLGQARAAEEERFEISSMKAVRPSLVDTITALQQGDAARARAAFAD